MKEPQAPAFLASVWFTLLLPILIRRRRAAIFTCDTFIFRPALGGLLKVPLHGIKRAYLLDPEPGDEYHVPTVRIELLVGGNMDIRIGVANPEEIARRLNESALGTLAMPPTALQTDERRTSVVTYCEMISRRSRLGAKVTRTRGVRP